MLGDIVILSVGQRGGEIPEQINSVCVVGASEWMTCCYAVWHSVYRRQTTDSCIRFHVIPHAFVSMHNALLFTETLEMYKTRCLDI